MATQRQAQLTNPAKHAVGNLNSLKVKTLAHGAICTEDIDNFTLVELGFNADGERTCSQLTDVTKQSYLIASPEVRYMDEGIDEFYNGTGERARIVILEPNYTRFETSAFSLNAGVTEVQNGQVAHFDPATKKFIISDAGTPHVDYANAKAKFLVVNNEEDMSYTLGAAMVRLEVIEA